MHLGCICPAGSGIRPDSPGTPRPPRRWQTRPPRPAPDMQPRCIAIAEGNPGRIRAYPPAAAYDAPTMHAHLFSTSVHGPDADAMSDLEQLVRASRLYYELGETQSAIAEQLGVTRPQVSRLLKRARAEGIVEIRIIDSTHAESPAGEASRQRYGLDAVHLAPTDRRPRGPDPPDGRPARRAGAARRRSGPARSSGSATAPRSRRRPTRSTEAARRRDPDRGHRRAPVRRLLVDRPGARAVPPGRRGPRRPGRTG